MILIHMAQSDLKLLASKIGASLHVQLCTNFTILMCTFFVALTLTATKISIDLLPHPQIPFTKTELRFHFDFFLSRHCSFSVTPFVGFRCQTLHHHNSSTTDHNRVFFFHRRATLYSTHTQKIHSVPNPEHVQKDPPVNGKVDFSTAKLEARMKAELEAEAKTEEEARAKASAPETGRSDWRAPICAAHGHIIYISGVAARAGEGMDEANGSTCGGFVLVFVHPERRCDTLRCP